MNPLSPTPESRAPKVVFDQYSAWFGGQQVLREICLPAFAGERLAVIGPAGSGKTTLLRSLNRLHDLTPEFRHQGRILLDQEDIFHRHMNAASLRQRVALMSPPWMPLPGSIFDNVALALKMAGEHDKQRICRQVETGLKGARLWEQLKDRLDHPAIHLSSGMVRRLGLARSLALDPEVLLIDEPCAGQDNVSATVFEDTLDELKSNLTIIFATNDPRHAARGSDRTAVILKGELIEWGTTRQIFTQPARSETNDFITERF